MICACAPRKAVYPKTDRNSSMGVAIQVTSSRWKNAGSSNTYNDWTLERSYALVPLQQVAAAFLITLKEYPPSQTPGSFNLEKIQKQIEAGSGSK
jgi:hypothetical protein